MLPPRIEVQTPDQLAALAARAQSGDERAKTRLIAACRGMLATEARAAAWSGQDTEDLIQVGVEGLLVALGRYDPAKGGFAGYARLRVREFVADYANRNSMSVSPARSRRDRWLQRHCARLANEHAARNPMLLPSQVYDLIAADARAAGHITTDAATVEAMLSAWRSRGAAQIDGDDVAGEEDEDDQADDLALARSMVAQLPERTQEMIRLRLAGVPREEVGRMFGCSHSVVDRTVAKALELVREAVSLTRGEE